MDKTISVVVFYESSEVRSLISELLRGYAEDVFYSNITKEQKEFVAYAGKNHNSFLFIYAFDDPRFATDLFQLLHNHESLAPLCRIPQLSILFCNREFRKEAFQECISKRFFFYETIRPVYDMNRVRLLLELSSDFLLQKIHLKQAEDENCAMREKLQDVSTHLEGIEDSISDEKGVQSGLLSDLSDDIYDLSDPKEEYRKQAATDAEDARSKVQAGLDEFQSHNQEYFSSLGQQVKSAKPVMEKNEPLVIVADDQKMMLKIISTILKPKGFRLELASNGAEALMKAKVFKPQVILLDIDMPIMNGIDTLKAVKKLEELRSVPVIMLTSNSEKSSFMECRKLGAVDYIVKPTNAEILLKKILAVL